MGGLRSPVKRDDYLRDPDVRAFLDWAKPLVTGQHKLNHPRAGGGKYSTLHEAYRDYQWDKKSSEETVKFLEDLANRIGESQDRNDPETFREAAKKVLRWGGVSGRNAKRLEALGDEALPLLRINARLLDPATADLERVWVVQPMNSGFSKIYSLMLEGFPIYDSRVACALGSLVRSFCEVERMERVPDRLKFGIPPDRAHVERDPSYRKFSFPKIRHGGSGLYAQSNVMAAWILDEMSQHGPFGDVGDEQRLFALQSAMFMIGHAPLAKPALD